MNILAIGNHLSGDMKTGISETETTIDWLDYASLEIEPLSNPEPLCGALADFTMVNFLI